MSDQQDVIAPSSEQPFPPIDEKGVEITSPSSKENADSKDPVPSISDPSATTSSTLEATIATSSTYAPEVSASTSSNARSTTPTPATTSAPPSRRRPKPPSKGILKPPPPPAKPSLGNRLRDIVTVVGGGAKSLFEYPVNEEGQDTSLGGAGPTPLDLGRSSTSAGAGPSTSSNGLGGLTASNSVGGALNALSGRIGIGLSRLVAGTSSPRTSDTGLGGPGSGDTTPPGRGSPLPPTRSMSVPENGRFDKGKRKDLKRATFILPSLSITYPISSQGEPWSEKVLEDRKRIENTHRSLLHTTTGAEYWTSQRLVALYENACRGREERPRIGIVRALEVLPNPPKPRTIHIIHRPFDPTAPPLPHPAPYTLETPLNRHAAEAFADVLVTQWGLTELKLESGTIDSDDCLKSILHALLVSGTLPTLSLAGNRKIRSAGWRLLGIFIRRARSLRYLDVSDTNWDKSGIEYLVQALNSPHPSKSIIETHPNPQHTSDRPQTSPLRPHAKSEPQRIRPNAIGLSDPADKSNDTKKDESSAATAGVIDLNEAVEKCNVSGQDADDEDTEVGDEKATEDVFDDHYGSFIPSAPLLKHDLDKEDLAAVQTLRMDGCGLRANVLETLAQGVRSSDLRNISLRRNRIGPLGAVSLALMIRDYPDNAVSMSNLSPALTASLSNTSLASVETAHSPSPSPAPTPYAIRRRPQSSPLKKDDAPLPPVPVTARPILDDYRPPPPPKHQPGLLPQSQSMMKEGSGLGSTANPGWVNMAPVEGKLTPSELGGASMALQRSVRALDGVERIGRLLTLDLKSNDIRNGVGFIAQVLKRNRTLKVLNLSENRIEPAGMAQLSEALKYNSTLETLDLSSNPCCGPSMEGVTALRTAFTVNTSIKRLFLSDTALTTEGAIALAEFLPESKSLLHLDVSANPLIGAAGVLAMSVGLKSNTLLRCLDVSIPPNNREMADLSQSILQSCIRNTEFAVAHLQSGDQRVDAMWAPIKKSRLVRNVKEADELRAEDERVQQASSPEGLAREFVYTLQPNEVAPTAEKTIQIVERWYEAGKSARQPGFSNWEPGQLPKEDFFPTIQRCRVLQERMVEIIQSTTDESLEKLLGLNDALGNVVDRSKGFKPPPRLLLPSQVMPSEPSTQSSGSLSSRSGRHVNRRHKKIPSLEISSPNFSIGDSDDDSDAEELDVGSLTKSSSISQISMPSRPLHLPLPKDMPHAEVGVEASSPKLEYLTSPVERESRKWVEEEGEIFRKGMKLGLADSDEEMEKKEDVSGDVLKEQLLKTPVERSPTRRVIPVEDEETNVDNVDARELED